jgi:hypothetical protein
MRIIYQKLYNAVNSDGKKSITIIVSPNGQWLLFTQVEQDERDIILVENFQ